MIRISWLINRVRVMSVPEVLFRIRRSLTQKWERKRVTTGWKPLPVEPVTLKCPLFGDGPGLPGKWAERFQLDTSRLDECLESRVSFFGHKPLDVGNSVNWNRDPVTGIEAPGVYGKDLNYRDDAIVGNVKFTWELGRHQHLVPLAVAYVASGDVRYRGEIVEHIDSWIEQSPFGIGIHWCSSLEVSLRLISWAVVHSLIVLKDGESGLFASIKDSKRLGDSIYQQVYFVRHFLSRYSSANNHLIGEITGLWVACTVFELGRDGTCWAEFARNELENQARLQVYSDGVNKEQASYYHMWVLEYLLFAWMTGTRAGEHFSPEFESRLHAMLSFLKDLSPDDGEPPQIGDADDGFVTRFDPAWPEFPYKELINAADCVLGYSEEAINQKAFWYQALSGTDKKQVQTWSRHYPIAYREGGYAILGDENCHLVMDAGNLGYLGIAAHGHADALSICLALDGEWWLVDPGTYAYHSDRNWRNYFRGTKAHNTVAVNGADQSTIAGPFMWTQKASAKLLEVQVQQGVQIAVGEHDGYSRFGVFHRRIVSFDLQKHEIELIDELRGGKNAQVACYFHFPPQIKLKCEENTGNWVASSANSSRRLVFRLDKQWEMEVKKGQEDPVLGWYSPSLEVKVPTITLRGMATCTKELNSKITISII